MFPLVSAPSSRGFVFWQDVFPSTNMSLMIYLCVLCECHLSINTINTHQEVSDGSDLDCVHIVRNYLGRENRVEKLV